MNKDELMAKSKEELVEKIFKMKENMHEGDKCACKCDNCGKCSGFKGEGMDAKK